MINWLDSPFLQPMEAPMKDGRVVVIRPLRMEDAAGLLEMERALHATGVGVVRLLDELPETPEEQAEQMESAIITEKSVVRGVKYVALVDGVLVGNADIKRVRWKLLRHVSRLSIGIHPDYQELGIGRVLMARLLGWALEGPGTSHGGIRRIELGVFESNTRARRLYESLGFEIEGRHRNFLRLPDGSLETDITMAMVLPAAAQNAERVARSEAGDPSRA